MPVARKQDLIYLNFRINATCSCMQIRICITTLFLCFFEEAHLHIFPRVPPYISILNLQIIKHLPLCYSPGTNACSLFEHLFVAAARLPLSLPVSIVQVHKMDSGDHNPGQWVEQPASAKALHGEEEELGVSEARNPVPYG